MSQTPQVALLAALAEHRIPYLRVDHPAVYTCEEAAELVPPIEGAETKNLFLRDDKRSRYFLVSLPAEKSADLKALAGVLGVKRLTMASAEDLADHLGVAPGSVTPLAAFNDQQGRVEIKLDAELASQQRLLCHPLVNTATLSITVPDLTRFLDLYGHALEVVEVPARMSTPA
ncbi:prolyl-tRNA synthetase associated domain-containing protein [Chitinimonas sp.]|uniref:prolyl-tRNA synthetase associated domain-containing protein n=1 Tax=Chitinimonas sp. TaxID=1934313 RepID=UPI002F920005